MSEEEEEEESILDNFKFFSDVTKTFVVIIIFVLFGLVIVGWKVADNTTTAIFWSLACFVSGGIIGFLFGIPRVLQDTPTVAVNDAVKPAGTAKTDASAANDQNKNKPNSKAPTAYRIMVNTNLEQISDWLTKIIVGLGLIELRNVPGYLNSLSGYFAIGLGGTVEKQSLASAIIIYFVVIGFLGVYLMTRIYLAQVFSKADRETQETEELKSARISLQDASENLKREWKEVKETFNRGN